MYSYKLSYFLFVTFCLRQAGTVYYFSFNDKEAKAHNDEVMCPLPWNLHVAKLILQPIF